MAQQQTWTEWIFGANASSPTTTVPSTTGRDGSNDSGLVKVNDPAQNAQSSSPYGPYVKTGRGGAGNYTWQSSSQSGTAQHDIETNKTLSLMEQAEIAAEMERHETEAALQNKRGQHIQGSQFVRLGRSYVDRKDLQSVPQPPTPKPKVVSQISRSAYRGRGGAGNYAVAAEETKMAQAERQERDRRTADKLTEQVTKDVDNNIIPPQDAWLRQSKQDTTF